MIQAMVDFTPDTVLPYSKLMIGGAAKGHGAFAGG